MRVVSIGFMGLLKNFSLLPCSSGWSSFFFHIANPLLFRKRSGFLAYRISKVHAYSSRVLGSRGRVKKKSPHRHGAHRYKPMGVPFGRMVLGEPYAHPLLNIANPMPTKEAPTD
jgi:hypothetical protein